MDLKNIDLSTLTEREMIQLQAFHQAYNRPYPPAMTWRDCRAEGLEPKEYTGCGLVEIQEIYGSAALPYAYFPALHGQAYSIYGIPISHGGLFCS